MEMFLRSLRLAFAIGLSTTVLSTAEAAQFTYTNLPLPVPDNRPDDQVAAVAAESAFFTALSSYGTEKYDSGITTGFSDSQALTFGGTGVTGVSQFSGVFTIPGLPTLISSPNALVLQPAGVSHPAAYANDFTFNVPVTAFGSYFIQAGDGTVGNTLTLRLENTILGTSKDVVMGTVGPSANFNNVFYFGVTDTDSFNKVTFLATNSGDGILLDNTTVGSVAVPEAGSISLLAIGLVIPAMIFARNRARSAA